MLRSRHLPRTLLVLLTLMPLNLLAAQSTPAQNAAHKRALAEQIAAVMRQPQLVRAHWGINVVELESGKTIDALNPEELFLPASNAKLFTTAAALAAAGPDYRFSTTVESTGAIDGN